MASEKEPIFPNVRSAEPRDDAAHSPSGPRPGALSPHPASPRAGVLGALKTLLAVIPLTILIWAYAEREEVEKGGLTVQIRLHSSSPAYLVRTMDPLPSAQIITVNIEGSRAKVEKVRSRGGSDQRIVDIAVPADLPEGKTTPLTLQQQLEDAPIFKDNGIAVKSCIPASIDVRVDQLVSVDVRPGLRPGVGSRIIGKVVFDPPVVTLRGPRSVLHDPESLRVYADPPESDIPTSAIDGHQIPDVPVRLGRSDDTITITPSTVKISIQVKASSISYLIPNVPVFVRMPSTMQDRYRVTFPHDASMSRITVVGPEDQIAKLQNEKFAPEATLNILTDDVRGTLPRAPTYTLPPDVTVSEADKSRTIDFRLVDRNAPE